MDRKHLANGAIGTCAAMRRAKAPTSARRADMLTEGLPLPRRVSRVEGVLGRRATAWSHQGAPGRVFLEDSGGQRDS